MATRLWSVCATIALAGTCAAQEFAQIDVKGRLAGTTDWLDTVETAVLFGDPTVNVEVAVFFRWSGADAVAMSTCVNSPVINGWDAGLDAVTLRDRNDSTQHPDGRQGNFNFGGQRQAAYTGGVHDIGRLRIAAPNNTQANPAGGVSVKQNTPVALGTNLDTSNPALGFRFDIRLRLDVNAGDVFRSVVGDVPLDLVNSFNAYANTHSNEIRDQKTILLPTDPLAIRFYIPAPGAGLALIGGCGVLVARRRR